MSEFTGSFHNGMALCKIETICEVKWRVFNTRTYSYTTASSFVRREFDC